MDTFFVEVVKLKTIVKKIYIYGAGLYGQNIFKILKKNKIEVDGFIVTARTNETTVLGVPVYEAKEVLDENIGIIIGVNRHNVMAVRKVLNDAKFDANKIVWGNEYIDKNGVRGGYDEIPTLEITTRIGCSVNCKYCPQSLLLEQYYKNNSKREKVMNLDTFSKCLEKLPKECTILFSGMSEPFLNPECGKMLKLACDSGRKVDLYTTLVGTTKEDIELIAELPIGFIGLHVADKRKYANIPVSEEYYNKVLYLVNRKKENGAPLINVCNAQTEPDERIAQICEGKYDILTTMLDRAGNLKNEELFSKQCLKGKISCSLCGDKLNHNILLPDGTVLLCCMDYGMKHVLGNLLETSYEEITQGSPIGMIKQGLMGDESRDILCRNCSCANVCV